MDESISSGRATELPDRCIIAGANIPPFLVVANKIIQKINCRITYQLSGCFPSIDNMFTNHNVVSSIHFFCLSKRNEPKKKTLFQGIFWLREKTEPKTSRNP
jgi:hypothetical protein